VTSFGISVSQTLFVKLVGPGSLTVFWIAAAGGCCGIACSIWFYEHVIKRKSPPKSTITVELNAELKEFKGALEKMQKMLEEQKHGRN
jgi:hypothetical protein